MDDHHHRTTSFKRTMREKNHSNSTNINFVSKMKWTYLFIDTSYQNSMKSKYVCYTVL